MASSEFAKKKKRKPSFAGYPISTSVESDMDGVYGYAFCPICGFRGESAQHEHECDEQRPINEAVEIIRTHMTHVHKLEDNLGA